MQRIQEHRLALSRVINDDRIGGDNRFLAELLAMWADCQIPKRGGQPKTPEEIAKAQVDEEFFKTLILARFVSKRGDILKHANKEEDDTLVPKLEKEATALERAAIDELLGRG
jgi:hypothetical protein